ACPVSPLPLLLSPHPPPPAGPGAAAAQDPAHVDVRFEAAGAAVPGGTVEVRAVAAVAPEWHIYATRTDNGLPTALALTLPPGVTLDGPVGEPEPHLEEIEFVGPVSIHRGTVAFTQRLRLADDVALPLRIPATLTWQACDDANTSCVMGEAAGSVEVPGAAGSAAPLDALIDADDAEVRARVTLEPRDGGADLVVTLQVRPGFHIYATETPNGQPTTLVLDLPAGVTAAGPLQEPAPKDKEVEFVGPVRVHEGTVRLVQPLRFDAGAAGTVAGAVAWQVCDDSICLQGEQPFALALGGGPAPTPAVKPPAPPAGAPPTAAPAAQSDLLTLFVAAVGLGLLMLFQPCTYPMIPITVSIFSKGTALPRRTAIFRAGVYAVGIVASFVLVGAVVQVLFGAAGQGSLTALATNPFVNLAIGVIFIYFAFSFFGYYELGLPAPLQRLMQLGNATRTSDGTVPTWSLFLMGFFFVLTSYTCGAPIVLALFATSAQDPHPSAVIFATAVFAATVATPFFALSLVPGAVRSLPKSGSWFSAFKVVIGFLELGFALKFLRGADVIWSLDVLRRPVLLALWALLCLLAAVYLLGRLPLRFPHDPDLRQPSTARGFWAALLLVAAGYFGAGVAGRPLLEELEAFILAEHEAAADGDGPAIKFGPLAYRTDLAALEEGKARARRTKRPVFVMFTGHNCVNCALMEAKVLPQPEVVARLEAVPRVALFTDRGEEERRHLEFMQERFRTTVLPSFYLLDADGNVLAAQNGGSDQAAFLSFLERGGL
ncbi:MAG: thioredoxin fold domain-containing protein, partial [Planctomycetes bacterium]|nr:thioredoxin fold domain-containing protein [Planctomycetota bacterium]